jgi:hypothetical protein
VAQDGWDADERRLWIAHLGARNAMHHTSSALVILHSDVEPDQRLTWESSIDVRSCRRRTHGYSPHGIPAQFQKKVLAHDLQTRQLSP